MTETTTETAEDFLKRVNEMSESSELHQITIDTKDLKRLVRIASLSFPPRMGNAAK